jgi:hypothetical protein
MITGYGDQHSSSTGSSTTAPMHDLRPADGVHEAPTPRVGPVRFSGRELPMYRPEVERIHGRIPPSNRGLKQRRTLRKWPRRSQTVNTTTGMSGTMPGARVNHYEPPANHLMAY